MKTLIKSMVLAALIGASVTAKAGIEPENSGAEAKSMLQKKINLPEELKVQGFTETVKVIFTVDQSGCVNEVVAVTTNPILKKSIEAQMKSISFNALEPNKTNTAQLKFRVY